MLAFVLVAGCAEFDDTAAGQSYQPAPELTPKAGPQPEIPGVGDSEPGGGLGGSRGPNAPQKSVPPPQGCTDYDKAVIATCLDTATAIAALPQGGSGPTVLAGEQRTGKVFLVTPKSGKTELATLEVTAAGDGGLTALAPSPSYREDQLLFAYITTETDNRVVRFAKGQPPKPVLTGIPKGPTGNRGALLTGTDGTLLVATGSAGDPAAAADPASLAGKVLRIDTSGEPAADNPKAGSPVLSSGLTAPGGLCMAEDGSRVWVTDRAADKGAVYLLRPGEPLNTPAWTWPERPGVAGCVDWAGALSVATSKAGNVQNLPISPQGAVTGEPQVSFDGKNGTSYGRLAGMDLLSKDLAVVGTVNKDGGEPVSSDDRVVLIPRSSTPRPGPD